MYKNFMGQDTPAASTNRYDFWASLIDTVGETTGDIVSALTDDSATATPAAAPPGVTPPAAPAYTPQPLNMTAIAMIGIPALILGAVILARK